MKNETVLITGASSGIGLELAKCFAADGCRLVLVARNRPALEDLAATLKDKFKIEPVVLAADLSLPEAPRQVFDSLAGQKISVDVLINNAGFGLHGRFADMPLAGQLEIVKVNVMALTELTGLFLPEMLRKKGGGILNVGSVAGFVPGPNMAIYYATKAYVQSLSEALAEELAGTGVSMTVLCPGPTESNFSAVARGDKARIAQSAKMSAESVARFGHFAFRNRKIVAVPGFRNRSLVFLTRLMPRQTIRRTVKSYNRLKD
jgi:short-subunit dehydrogenase